MKATASSGSLGGIAGARLKIPAGSLIVAMLTIIIFKLITKTHWEMPRGFNFVLQVALGIMVGASFQPAMLPVLKKIFFPVLTSTVTLVGVGILLSIVGCLMVRCGDKSDMKTLMKALTNPLWFSTVAIAVVTTRPAFGTYVPLGSQLPHEIHDEGRAHLVAPPDQVEDHRHGVRGLAPLPQCPETVLPADLDPLLDPLPHPIEDPLRLRAGPGEGTGHHEGDELFRVLPVL